MKTLNTIITTLSLFISLQQQGFSQSVENKTNKSKFSLEIDPATFGLGGYSIHLRLQPKTCSHLLIGVGTYALDMPDVLVDFNSNNKDKGWNIRINQGYSFFAEHHFTEVNTKWFVGTQLGVQEFKIKMDQANGSEKFSNLLTMGYIGYTAQLGKSKFYLKPWAGIGYTTKVSGDNKLNTSVYDIAPITMFLTLHAGYTF